MSRPLEYRLKLKLKAAPVHIVKDLTPEQIKAYRIAENQTGALAEWDLVGVALASYDSGKARFIPGTQ